MEKIVQIIRLAPGEAVLIMAEESPQPPCMAATAKICSCCTQDCPERRQNCQEQGEVIALFQVA